MEVKQRSRSVHVNDADDDDDQEPISAHRRKTDRLFESMSAAVPPPGGRRSNMEGSIADPLGRWNGEVLS